MCICKILLFQIYFDLLFYYRNELCNFYMHSDPICNIKIRGRNIKQYIIIKKSYIMYANILG